MMSTDERLAYMVDQIMRNFKPMGQEAAIAATANHIVSFWDPSMRQRAFALIESDDRALFSEAARLALQLVRNRCAPLSRGPAAEGNQAGRNGSSNAG